MVSKYIESYGKHALAVNQRHPKKAIQKAILCFTYFRLIENGLYSSKVISPTASSRITRWTLTLSAYTFTIRYKPGKDLGNADALSRLPRLQITDADGQPAELIHMLQQLSSTTINAASIRRWTDTHPVLSKIRQFILQGWPTTQLNEEF